MKNSILIISTLLFLCTSVFAQRGSDSFTSGHHKSITVGVFNANLTQGLNFDMRFQKNRLDGLGFKVGVGGFAIRRFTRFNRVERGLFSIPLELNYVVGKRRHGLVVGAGALPVYASLDNTELRFNNQDLSIDGLEILGAFGTLGYRYQPLNKGITFQINYNPVVTQDHGIYSQFGFQIGIGFK